MFKQISVVVFLVLVSDTLCQYLIHPTYKPPPRPLKIRTVRDTENQGIPEPLWLYQGDNIPRAPSSADNGYLPSIIDDVRFNPDRRYARSIDFQNFGQDSVKSVGHYGASQRFREDFSPFMPRPPTFPNPRPLDPFNPFPRPGRPYNPYPILYANN